MVFLNDLIADHELSFILVLQGCYLVFCSLITKISKTLEMKQRDQSTEYECDNKHNKISWGDTLTGLYGGEQLKEFLKCCSQFGIVFPTFQHDFIQFERAQVRFRQYFAILAFECILNELRI